MIKSLYIPGLTQYPFILTPDNPISLSDLAVIHNIDDLRLSLIFKYNPVIGLKPCSLWLYACLNKLNIKAGKVVSFVTTIKDISKTPVILSQYTVSLNDGQASEAELTQGYSDKICCDTDNTYFIGYFLQQSLSGSFSVTLSNPVIDPSCLLLTYNGPSVKLRTSYPKQQAYMLSDSLPCWESLSVSQSSSLQLNAYGYNTTVYISNNLVILNGGYSQGLGLVPDLRAYKDIINTYDALYYKIYGTANHISQQISESQTYTPDKDIKKLNTGLISINGMHNNIDITGGIDVSIKPTNQVSASGITTTTMQIDVSR